MGFWNKVSGFFGRVWNGIKSGVKKVGRFITNIAKPIYNTVGKPLIGMLPGGGTITSVIDKALPVVETLSGGGGS